MAAAQCRGACRRGHEVELLFRPNSRMGMKCDLKDFDRGMIVGARQDCLCISSNLLAFSCTTVARMYKEWCEKKKKLEAGLWAKTPC